MEWGNHCSMATLFSLIEFSSIEVQFNFIDIAFVNIKATETLCEKLDI